MSSHSTSARRRWLVRVGLVIGSLVALTACSVEQALPPPRCDGGSSLIVAQSVPTGELIPCFTGLPEGWSFSSVAVDQDGTVVRLDHDRAGTNAANLRYDPSCPIDVAVGVPSSFEGVARFDNIERLQPGFRARIHYQFEGGCVTWIFDFDKDASATESVALEDVLDLVSRDALNDGIREDFMDAEL